MSLWDDRPCIFSQMIREALKNDISVMQKSSPVDLVTETDQKVEQFIITSIKEKFPTHRWTLVVLCNALSLRGFQLRLSQHYTDTIIPENNPTNAYSVPNFRLICICIELRIVFLMPQNFWQGINIFIGIDVSSLGLVWLLTGSSLEILVSARAVLTKTLLADPSAAKKHVLHLTNRHFFCSCLDTFAF